MKAMRGFGWLAAAVVVLVTNGLVLGRVAINRSGEPEAELKLTERELWWANAWRDEEDTGAFFQLRVNHSGGRAWDETDSWLNREKLAGLGFDVEAAEQRLEGGLPWGEPARNVFIALEFEGPAWRAAVKRLEETYIEASKRFAEGEGGDEEQVAVARSNWERAKTDESRLFIIDADPDPEALRARYPDRSQVAIAPAEVSVYPSYGREDGRRITGS